MSVARELRVSTSQEQPDGNQVPIAPGWERPFEPAVAEALQRMAARGLVTMPERSGPREPFTPLEVPGLSLSELVIKERSEGR